MPEQSLDSYNEEHGFRPILHLLQRTLVEHITSTKLNALTLSGAVLSCATHLGQLYIHYFKNCLTHSNLSQNIGTTCFINPMLKSHLKENASSLSNFIKELDRLFQRTPQFIELLSRFLVYTNLLTESLINNSKAYSFDIGKLKDLFEWSKSNFNITDIHIDSISICKSVSSQRPNNENSLDNVLVLIVNYEQESTVGLEDSLVKFCASQTKRLVNTLNEVSNSSLVTDAGDSGALTAGNKGLGVPAVAEFGEFFGRRPVYSVEFEEKEMQAYEKEWCQIK